MVSELMENILKYLNNHDKADSLDLSKYFNVDHQKVVGAIKSLQAFENVSFLLLFHSFKTMCIIYELYNTRMTYPLFSYLCNLK
jgi:hypothetical protein